MIIVIKLDFNAEIQKTNILLMDYKTVFRLNYAKIRII